MAKTIITGQFAATQLDRLAGLYITGKQGLLTAAEVSNKHF